MKKTLGQETYLESFNFSMHRSLLTMIDETIDTIQPVFSAELTDEEAAKARRFRIFPSLQFDLRAVACEAIQDRVRL